MLCNVQKVLRNLAAISRNSIYVVCDLFVGNHVWLLRGYRRIRYTSVLEAIRVGLYPTIDEINVTNLIAHSVTGFTDVISFAMVLEREATLDAKVCQNKHDPLFQVVIVRCKHYLEPGLSLGRKGQMERRLGLCHGGNVRAVERVREWRERL